jgi:selenocysteine lyase/cysteine desulfurase
VVRLTKEAIDREHAKGGNKIVMGILDALSSLPGVRVPFEAITKLFREYGILSMVDGAHSIGQIELDFQELDPDFFVTNCHKWLYTPRGCAILYTPKRNQGLIHPTTINYAYEFHADAADHSSFALEHFPGTIDTSPFLCVSAGKI